MKWFARPAIPGQGDNLLHKYYKLWCPRWTWYFSTEEWHCDLKSWVGIRLNAEEIVRIKGVVLAFNLVLIWYAS